MKSLPVRDKAPDPNEERLGHLREYLLMCLRQNILTKSDLLRLDVADKIGKTILADAASVAKEVVLRFAFAAVVTVADKITNRNR